MWKQKEEEMIIGNGMDDGMDQGQAFAEDDTQLTEARNTTAMR